MPDARPTPVDPGDALSELYWLTDCHCDPAWTDRQLHAPDCNAHLRESVDVVAAELRSRTSIGPDSERIRELEAENARLDESLDETLAERDRLTELLDQFAYAVAPMSEIGEHTSANDPWANALDLLIHPAAGLLPGPDDIVVSREALDELRDSWRFKRSVLSVKTSRSIADALSQPHPAQEQQT